MSATDQNLAFERIVQPHLDRLYRLAWRLTGHKAEAEDLFQALLVKAFDKLEDLANIEKPGPWLARVMYNLFIDEKRRFSRQRMHVVEEGVLGEDGVHAYAEDIGGPDYDSERLQTIQALEGALNQLSDDHRVVVLLHDTEGYKLDEIQTLIGVPVGTIKSRLHRARARLREILSSNGTL